MSKRGVGASLGESAAFVSYSRSDAEFALRLAADLKAGAANVWLDQLDIHPGQHWDSAIEGALARCVRMLVILSPASVQSTHVMDEVSYALDERKTVIPLIYKDCAVPFRLRRLQHVDFRQDYGRGLDALRVALSMKDVLSEGGALVSHAATRIQPYPSDSSDSRPKVKGEFRYQEFHSIVLSGHTSIVFIAAFSPDGTRILTAGDDYEAHVWDGTSGTLLQVLRHTDSINSAEFSPDSKLIVTASEDGSACIWNVVDGHLAATLSEHTGAVSHAVFSPDCTQVVTASSDSTARVWDVKTGRAILSLAHANDVDRSEYSPDGRHIATASSKTITVWDVAIGAPLLVLGGPEEPLDYGTFSPQSWVFLSAHPDHDAKIWDLATGSPRPALIGNKAPIKTASFSRDGQRIVTTSHDNAVRVWDANTGSRLLILAVDMGHVDSADFSPDGREIVTVASGAIKVWDSATVREIVSLTGPDSINAATFSPDGQRIVTSGHKGTVVLWSTVR